MNTLGLDTAEAIVNASLAEGRERGFAPSTVAAALRQMTEL